MKKLSEYFTDDEWQTVLQLWDNCTDAQKAQYRLSNSAEYQSYTKAKKYDHWIRNLETSLKDPDHPINRLHREYR